MSNHQPRKPLSLKRGGDDSAASKLEERLHKVLAQAGLGSRRALEQRIADGKVVVNGEPAKVGMSIKAGDKIVTTGGIVGTVTAVNDNIFVVKIADNVKVEIVRSSVSQVLEKGEVGDKDVQS